jgi:hypothetical protein
MTTLQNKTALVTGQQHQQRKRSSNTAHDFHRLLNPAEGYRPPGGGIARPFCTVFLTD